jgi:hypothetical protein
MSKLTIKFDVPRHFSIHLRPIIMISNKKMCGIRLIKNSAFNMSRYPGLKLFILDYYVMQYFKICIESTLPACVKFKVETITYAKFVKHLNDLTKLVIFLIIKFN